MQIAMYTDGACDIHADNQPGGWAAILCAVNDKGKVIKETVISGGQEMTTNNQMELTAVIKGLKQLNSPMNITIVTDSKYVIDIASKEKRIVANKSLWQEFFQAAARHQIKWRFILGHAGHKYNEKCDRLAVAERRKLAKPKIDSPAQTSADTTIKIYLSTQYSGRKKAAGWAAVIVHGNHISERNDTLVNATELEAVLIGAIETLRSLPANEAATLYTAQQYLAQGMNQWINAWAAKNWKNTSGQAVKYQAHWKKLLRLTEERTVYFEFVKSRGDNPYFVRGKELTALLMNAV